MKMSRLTYLIFSILFTVICVIPAMAAEGGPTATIAIDDSPIEGLDGNRDGDIDPTTDTGNPAATPPEPADDTTTIVQVVDGENVLLTNAARTFTRNFADIADTTPGQFRVIVTFNRDVYRDSTETDQTAETGVPAGLLGGFRDDAIDGDTPPDETLSFTAYPLNGDPAFALTGTVTRVDTVPDVVGDSDTAGIQPHKRQFLITIAVPDTNADQAPFIVRVNIPENAVFSMASDEKIVNGEIQDEVVAVGSQAASMDFTVIPKLLLKPTLGGSTAPGKYGIHETITLTLNFSPAPAEVDRPSRTNIIVENGSFGDPDPTTPDIDEGFLMNEAGTMWTITLVPAGGVSQHYMLTVKNALGAPFVFSRSYTIDSRPPSLQVDISGTPIKGGAPFVVTITYGVAPANDLTQDGVTVTGGTIVSGSFAGSGTTYMLTVDPTDTTAGNPGELTVRVGQDSRTFTIPAPDAEEDITPDDPNSPVKISIEAGIAVKEYLVITPAMIVADDTTTMDMDESMNTDVLPSVGVTHETQAAMPDLEDLLYGGGTVDVYVDAGTGSTAADIIINEVMWALDENEVGTDGHTAHQWIELYNNSNENAAAGTITLWFKPRTLSGVPTDLGTRTDRLSNVLRFGTTTGWVLGDNHGQSGNSHPESTKEFISMYRKADKRGDNDGINGAHWLVSTELSHTKHRGTPGKENTRSAVSVTTRPAPRAYTPPKSLVLINEVYNDANNDFDWLELRFLQNTNLENWTLSYAKSDFTEVEIMRFPKRAFNAGDILLIVNKNPRDTKLAAGQDVTLGGANQARGAGSHKYWNPSGGNSGSPHYLDIPDYNGGDFLLILRIGKGWERFGSGDRIHDVVGTGTFVRQTLNADTVAREPHTENPNDGKRQYIWNTRVWPLNGQNIRDYHKDHDSLLQNDRTLAVGQVWTRSGERDGWKKDGGYRPGNRGGLGYDRNVVANGTPGYDNGILKNKHTDLAGGKVVVSELMLTTDNGRYPQWIELHNTSKTNTVNLHADTDGNGARQGWSIRVENHKSDSWDSRRKDKLNVEVKFRDLGVQFIPPNQTILIVADKVRNSKGEYFPDHRVASIWATGAKGVFKMENRRDIFLNPKGFLLQVVDGSNQVSDAVGNLDGVAPTLFNDAGFDDPYSWNWPAQDALVINNRRTSLIRIYDDRVPRTGTPDRAVPDSMRGAVIPMDVRQRGGKYAEYAWVHTNSTKLAKAQITWYGSEDDHGTPGHTTNTPLPVELSFFRPTLENGEVVIRWTTESELDNAGFNIYRSDTRNGEFKQVNAEMIQGHGTTGERHTYKWVDTTAKPGAIYYYQIEDVSFAGERQTLAVTKLKGLISAKNKLTTTWGELKEVQ